MPNSLIEARIWYWIGREDPMPIGRVNKVGSLMLLAREDEEETPRLGGDVELGDQLEEVRVVLA